MKYTKENLEKRRKKVEITRKVFVFLVYLILIPIICFNMVIILQAATNSEETPSVFGIKTFVIISGSMEPNLNIGDIIVVKKVEQNELKKGDVISFRNGESVITHRINDIKIENNGIIKYETKGDNNNISDKNYVIYEDIEGRMVNKIPVLGKVALLLKNKVIIIIIIMIFYMMYIHNANVEERRLMRKEKRRVMRENYK